MTDTRSTLRFAALMTCAAVLLSEWYALADARIPHALSCLVFIYCFLWNDLRDAKPGWNLALSAGVLSAAGAVWFGGFGMSPALYVIVGGLLYKRLPRAQFWIVLAVLNAILLARLLQTATLAWSLSGLAAYAGFQLFGILMTITSDKLESANQALTQVNAELLATRALLTESTRSDERLRLSRELHDVCGHKLTALKFALRQAQSVGALQGEDLQLTQVLTDQLLQDVRAVVSTLRNDDGIDLRAAMLALQQVWRTPTIVLTMPETLRTPDVESAHQLLRVAQEAITNAARHGNAQHVHVSLREQVDALHLEIVDDGVGRAPFKLGNGLLGMRERVEKLRGSLEIASSTPRGVKLQVRIPLAQTLQLAPLS